VANHFGFRNLGQRRRPVSPTGLWDAVPSIPPHDFPFDIAGSCRSVSSLATSGSFYDKRFVPLCLVKQALSFLKFFDQKPKPIDRLGGMNLCYAEKGSLT